MVKMKQSSKMGFLFFVAIILSVLAFPCNPLIIFKVIEPNNIKELEYVGWTVWMIGIVFVFLSYHYIYYRKVKVLVDSGIYAVVRHPMYLGWVLALFVATIFLYQHWLFVIIGILGIASVYLISREEEYSNIEKFGDEYKRYMNRVPRANFLLGIIRHLRHTKNR
jgi:protein-S-isoprenylcysteine O-methyltransferase Ste14